MIVVFGIVLGIFIGISSFNILTQIFKPLHIIQANFIFNINFIFIIILVLIAGLVAAIFPAYHASKKLVLQINFQKIYKL